MTRDVSRDAIKSCCWLKNLTLVLRCYVAANENLDVTLCYHCVAVGAEIVII